MKKIIISTAVVFAIVISAIFLILLNGRDLVHWYLKPGRHFDVARVSPAPDYSNERNWAALPTRKNEANLAPSGLEAYNQADTGADVFYIHPTGYFSAENWNSTVDPEASSYKKVRVMLASQASAFNGCCTVYAPRYREASLYSFLDTGNDGRKAIDLAYRDIARAFDYYISHFNNQRPFIIASHSQGSVHALRLLEEKIDRAGLYNQFIAAYVVGSTIPVEKFTRSFSRIRPCTRPGDTGCVVSWNTCARGTVPRKMIFVWYRTGWEKIDDKDIVCTNPLSWKNDGKIVAGNRDSDAMLYGPGELLKLFLTGGRGDQIIGRLEVPVRLELTAQCINGFLYVPRIKEIADPFSRGNYHMYDYSLFYMNIRNNACERVSAFIKKR